MILFNVTTTIWLTCQACLPHKFTAELVLYGGLNIPKRLFNMGTGKINYQC